MRLDPSHGSVTTKSLKIISVLQLALVSKEFGILIRNVFLSVSQVCENYIFKKSKSSNFIQGFYLFLICIDMLLTFLPIWMRNFEAWKLFKSTCVHVFPLTRLLETKGKPFKWKAKQESWNLMEKLRLEGDEYRWVLSVRSHEFPGTICMFRRPQNRRNETLSFGLAWFCKANKQSKVFGEVFRNCLALKLYAEATIQYFCWF